MKTISASLSDKGNRKNNEDFIAFFEPIDSSELQQSGCLYVVADGIGGVGKGERASQFSAQKVLFEYYQPSSLGLGPLDRLRTIMEQVNAEIFSFAHQNHTRMATSIVAAVVRGDYLYVANVGDSRAYIIRDGMVKQINRDHSVVGEMVANGEMTEEEAMASKIKNRLTRSIGGDSNVSVGIYAPIRLKIGDKVLLCSDGLTRYASRKDVSKLTMDGKPEDITKRLVQYANRQGGADNISVIVIAYESFGAFEPTVMMPPSEQPMYSPPMRTRPTYHENKEKAIPHGFCPVHGPYDGTECPFSEPHTLDNENATEFPTPRRWAGSVLDYDEEDETELPRSAREDMTELDRRSARSETQSDKENLARHKAMEKAERDVAEKAAREKTEHEERNAQPSKKFKISISYPKLLSKRYESSFLLQVYLPEERSQVTRNVKSEFRGQKINEQLKSSSVKLGQKIKVKLFSPVFDFPESVTKLIDTPVSKITFLGMPKDNCEPGLHKVLVSISDANTDQEFESFTVSVQVVDFSFDHISRPLVSRVSAVVLGIGSFAMFMLTFLEQIDKTVGLTGGTAAGVLAAAVYANFYNLYQRVRPNTP